MIWQIIPIEQSLCGLVGKSSIHSGGARGGGKGGQMPPPKIIFCPPPILPPQFLLISVETISRWEPWV